MSGPASRSTPISDEHLQTLQLTDADDSAFYVAPDGRRYLQRNTSVYGASGPRIRVRFFAGYDLDPAMLDTTDGMSRAYTQGVSMGGDLMARPGDGPAFIVWAARDAQSAPLQRVLFLRTAVP
jgi:hypothetical protein